MAEVVMGAVSIVSGCLVAPVNRLCGYVISYESDVRELDHEVEKLANARDEVQSSIRGARNNVKPIKAKVEKWVREVETVTNEARDVLDYDRAKKTCFYGWLPNLKVRYRLSREARRKAKDIQGLIGRIPPGEVYDDPPPGLVDGTSDMISSAGDRVDTNFDSRASILEDIMNALGDEKHKVVGIYGEGGVGKTTLLKQVQKKLRNEKKLFHMIVKANVSQNPDFKKIQEDIAYALGLKNLKDETSEEGRKELLFKRLQNDPSEKVLIILDDLWKDLDLEAVGIPSKDESKGFKLLLTSRFKDVLEQMKCDTPIFHLEGLEDKEAFRLFEKTVGDRLKDDEELKAIAPKVVEKLAGLPLLIISVAYSLKDRDVAAWRIALKKIDHSKMETIVKLSYDHLKSEDTKTLFLLCGLIGGTIKVETLLALGMSLGLFEEFGGMMQDSRDSLITILDELRSACLLLDGGDDKENVTIHDLYSEVVVSTPFRGQNSLMMNSNYGSWSKEKLEKCWAICLADVDKRRLDKLMKCQFPNLKILILSQSEGWRWKQEHKREVGDCLGLLDFTYMKELRVLYFCFVHIASFPRSIEILKNLHSLYLDHCIVGDVAILGELEALQILSFAWSTISRLPEEIGKLTNLRLLNLNHCNSLQKIAPGALKGLINLEELHMKKSLYWLMGEHGNPWELCVAGLAELKSLTKLASLEISIPNPILLSEDIDLPFENLDKFWINVRHAEEMIYDEMEYEGMEYEGLTTMNLNLPGCDSILLKKGVKKNLQKTQCLYLRNLSEFEESPCELCTRGFREVKYLDIKDSPSIRYIADSSNAYSSSGRPLNVFGNLESFFLKNLINLEKIYHGPIAPECFNKLKAVRVGQCGKLKYLWCLSDVQRLVQLEEIGVWECDSMQSIIAHDAGEDIAFANNRVELRNVRRLELSKLPNMTSFCTKAEITSEDTPIQVSLPRLESPEMVELPGPEEILCSERSLKYSNLRLPRIESKSTSKSILKLDWILKLPNLESMSLESSPSAEEVFDLEELEVTEDVEILSRLTQLTLNQLPNLQRVCKQDVKLQGISILRNLRHLYIHRTGLSFLFSVSMAKCFREIRTITVVGCPKMKAVIVDEGRNEGTYDIIEFPLLEYLSIWKCRMDKFFSYPCGKKEPVTNSDSQDANSDSFFDQKVTFPNMTVLKISGLQCKELWNNQIPTNSFQKLESLKLENGDNLQHIAPPQMWKVLQRCLKNLEVISCPLIEIIYEGREMDTEGGELRELLLHDLKNVKQIWQSKVLPNVPFPNLIDVEAVKCPHLKMLFTTFTSKFLGQIKKLVVKSCDNMELIADHEKGEERTGMTVTFSKLTVLRLFELPNFRGFLPKKYSQKFSCPEDFPSLEICSIKSCGEEPDQVFGDTIIHSRASIFQDIMEALDDEKLKVIGVHGLSGVGKTTLLKEVEKKLNEEKRPFQMIVKAEVSQNPDLKNIQGQIADALGLELKDKQSQQERRDHLLQRLQKDPNEKVLIILDDLWDKLDLKAVGIPSGDESRGCKLLLTTRYGAVLWLKMDADRTYLLHGLEDDKAFRLFESTVGDQFTKELNPLAYQVVKKLTGLPLLIISVARTLKYSPLPAWRYALRKIEDSSIQAIVQLTYDHLESEDARSLFLLCGLIGGTIPVELLLVLGMGLGLFEGYNKTIKDSRDRLNAMLDSLRSICLLQDGGDDKENVTIHGLYSYVVVSTPFRGQNSLMMNSNYGSWSTKKLEKCWAICLADVDKNRLDKLMTCQFPDLKILMLSQLKDSGWMREHEHEVGDCPGLLDFTYMKELRVLYFRSMHIANLPPSIGILGSLHSLYLDECNVEDVAILGKLKALQILSFARSTISRLPKEIGELTNLRSLSLCECYKLETIEPGVLNRLTNLEELHIYNFSRWMGKDQIPSESCNARLAELKSLTKLSALAISIPDPTILLEDGDLPFENLDRFLINIGLVVGAKFKDLRIMTLELEGCESILSKEWIQKTLQKTQHLHLCKSREFKKSAHELCTQGFEEVKYINSEDSPSIKYIANSSDGLPLTAFRTLESLILENLIKLEKIYNGLVTPESFSKLRAISVTQCDRLKYLWSLSDWQRLGRLEEIDVWECNSMQSIVTQDAGEGIVSTDNRVKLPNVRHLSLRELPNMTSFCTKVEITSEDTPIQVSLPRLESLVMVGLSLEKILYSSEPSLKYRNLRWLKIKESKSTSKSILKLDWILKLPNLESISLGSSPSAEVVFDLEELKATGDVEICSRLTKLTLEQLPNLRRMWKRDVKLQGISIFRNLRELYIYETGLSSLFSVSVAKCFREIKAIVVSDCPNMKAVIVDEEGRNKGVYDIIEFPLLEHLSIWQCPMENFFLYPHGKKEPVTTTSNLQDAHSDSFFDRKVAFPNMTSLEINGLQCKELWNNQIPADYFRKLESLKLKNCDNLQHIANSYMWKKLQRCLEKLEVISCRSIEIIYVSDGMDTESGKLRSLVLHDLKNLRHIWQFDGRPNIPFPNLRDVNAARCPRLEMLFPTFTAKFLGQIEELLVESCEDMELIAGHENWEEPTYTTITFSKLTTLRLFKLSKFKSFLPEKYSLKFSCSKDFPSLRDLIIVDCGAEPAQVRNHLLEQELCMQS